ncbi:MAG: Fe-S-containing hydro-lyase [Oscillospiraceae bacterium]|nr:Fe-S-containing hydro-lyase [Oscillospiraceae bacterium]
MDVKRVSAPLSREAAAALRCGDAVLLSGTVYTARDAAHRRFLEALRRGEPLPFPVEDAVLFYVGPTPAPPGRVIGSAGPTTSYRMDAETPALLRLGLRGMIGKGRRSPEVIEAMRQAGAVYFGAIGGAGALLSECIRSAELVCYPDLGAEAVRRLEVADMPLTVVIDAMGQDLYALGRSAYLAQRAEAEQRV